MDVPSTDYQFMEFLAMFGIVGCVLFLMLCPSCVLPLAMRTAMSSEARISDEVSGFWILLYFLSWVKRLKDARDFARKFPA